MSVVVFGGYGVFGAHVSRELAHRGATVTVAGRDLARATALAETLGPSHRGIAVDVDDAARLPDALAGHRVAVHCAGPFSARNHALLDACLDLGRHYVDIADDRVYAAGVRQYDTRFRTRGLTAAYGCSSLPGLSLALARVARGAREDPPARARVTLFIGNDNPKSATAVTSVLHGLGRPIRTPTGTRHGFREHETVDLPPPFGRRTAYAFDSPDYDLLPDAVGARDVAVLVGFENGAAGPLFSLLGRVGSGGWPEAARVFASIGRWSRGGHSGGVVMAELFWPDGTIRRAALHSAHDGQRLAALPAAVAAHALAQGSAVVRGAVTADELLGAEALVSAVVAAGFERWTS